MLKKSITVKEYIRQKALGLLGLIDTGIDPRTRDERLTFVNNLDEINKNKLKEYNVWYSGDEDELINFYTRANSIDYNTDPLYNRNKKSYFWAVSSLENDIKRTHSGQPRNIVDTLVSIVGIPKIGVGSPDSVLEKLDSRLNEILEDNNFTRLLMQKARPMTLVEGWGAWKINWDNNFRDTPILLYYRAESVDFVWKSGQIIAIIYKDYFQDKDGKNYILFETRRIEKRRIKINEDLPDSVETNWVKRPCLIIEKDLYKINGNSEVVTPCELKDLPQLRDVQPCLIIKNFNRFLGAPSIIYEDNNEDVPGRSIYTGKIGLFDDEDQCHSQAANCVRRSTVHEYFNSLYLEKDEHTGMPIMPHDFDRKYIMFKGAKNGDGMSQGGPVQVTQPALNFQQYAMEEQNILLNIIAGIMSPATLGIDIAKKDNAEAQREKEKVTIFTRNVMMAEESKTLKTVMNDLLIADELMRAGKVTCSKYDVYVQYSEFADASYEAKLETVLGAWQSGIMSDEMAVEYLYGDSVSPEIRKRELNYIIGTKQQAQQQPMGPEDMGMFGELGAENEYNDAQENLELDGQVDVE